jgi:hypothetical protein
MSKERPQTETENRESNRVFYLLRDYYSNPEILIIVAPDKKSAIEMLRTQHASENHLAEINNKDVIELDLKSKKLLTLRPPGDRHLIR